MNVQKKPFISLWWAVYVLFAIGYPLFAMLTVQEELPKLGKITPFVLTTQNDEPYHFGNDDRPVVFNFIFTRCPDICPLLTAKMATIQERLATNDALLMSISVDPSYDQPQILTEYGQQFGADFESWYFLTGEESRIRSIINDFQLHFERTESAGDTVPNIVHSEKFILVDQFGEIRGFYNDDPSGINQLLRAIDQL